MQAIYDCCRSKVLDVMKSELGEALKLLRVDSQADVLSEKEFDRQRACGLLLLCVYTDHASQEVQWYDFITHIVLYITIL